MRRTLLLISLVFLPVNLFALAIPGTKGMVQAPTFTFENVLFVPLTSFAKAYGFEENWNSKTKIVTIEYQKSKYSFRAGSSYALINGRVTRMPANAKMVNGRLLIPFQFGMQVMALHKDSLIPNNNTKIIPQPKWSPAPLRGNFTIVLDPGHGGKDVGARGRRGLNEKDINLDIARRVRDKLQAKGINVVMTRSKDIFIELWRRVNIASNNKASLFVSIHTNAARNRTVNGIEVFYFAGACAKLNGPYYRQNQNQSYQYAKLAQAQMRKDVKSSSRGVKNARYFVLKNARTPAVLIEVGFITNSWEEGNLASTSHREKLAQAITQSIVDYKGKR